MEFEKKVSIWAGFFSSLDELDSYLEVDFNKDQSSFKLDFNLAFYDEDFAESDYQEDKDFVGLLEPMSYADSIEINAKQLPWKSKYNSLILLYDFQYSGEIVETENVYFLGSFNYKKE